MAKKRAVDEAREYRERVVEQYAYISEPPTLAGLVSHPCERFIYLQLQADEWPRSQWKAASNHWNELFKRHGELPCGFIDQEWMLTLPNGDSFCDFCVVRLPSLVSQTVAEMIPLVERGAALFREFAAATGRRTGMIEDQSVFVCDDGRRIPLTECAYRLLTDEERKAPKRRAKRK